jgi:hypothetical protein
MTSAQGSGPSIYDVYPVAPRGTALATGERPSICFWNLSGRDIVLKVGGRTQTLPRGGRAQLQLERRFVWQVVGREEHTENLAASAAGVEIVIRR